MRTLPSDSLFRRVGIGLAGLFSSIILLGCGLTLNSAPGSGGTPGTGSPGGTGGESSPGSFQSLTGCANQNTGISNGDWGVGSTPVYTDPDNIVVGMSMYTSNAIFWTVSGNRTGTINCANGRFHGCQQEC